MNAITYETIEREIQIRSTLTKPQYERCHILTHRVPPQVEGWPVGWEAIASRHGFVADDDADLMALQQYVIEQKLPHIITTTREWKP